MFNVTRPLQERRFERLSKRQRRGNWWRQTKGSSVQRLSSPISPPKRRMTGGKLAQASVVTTGQVHPLLGRIWSSPRSQQGVCTNWRTRRWRRSKFGRARHSQWFSLWFLHHLRQHSHCWWVSRRRRASYPASFSPKRPPRRSRRGVQEIARLQTLLRCSGGEMSAAGSDRQRAHKKNLEVKFGLTISIFYLLFISAVRVVSIPTSFFVCPRPCACSCQSPCWSMCPHPFQCLCLYPCLCPRFSMSTSTSTSVSSSMSMFHVHVPIHTWHKYEYEHGDGHWTWQGHGMWARTPTRTRTWAWPWTWTQKSGIHLPKRSYTHHND